MTIPFDDLKPGRCKFPIGEGRGIRFCGEKASQRGYGSYCAAHAARAYVTTPARDDRYNPDKHAKQKEEAF